jgi:hypothetical protein
MTKIITAVIILAVVYGGWQLFFYWEKVKNEEETEKKQIAAAAVIGDQLPGMPPQLQFQLDNSLRAAQSQGAAALKNWLDTYGRNVQDPRKAWIELDYCTLLSRQNTAEARRIFAEVKKRTPQTSPVWQRIKQIEKTYE